MLNGWVVDAAKGLVRNAPHLVVLSLLVWLFLGHLEKVEARRGEVLDAISLSCHEHQNAVIHDVTEAMKEQTATSREVRETLIEIRTILQLRSWANEDS